jgi:hypothetical protein
MRSNSDYLLDYCWNDWFRCPVDKTRKSIAMYYYSLEPGETDDVDDGFITTLFRMRPDDKSEL